MSPTFTKKFWHGKPVYEDKDGPFVYVSLMDMMGYTYFGNEPVKKYDTIKDVIKIIGFVAGSIVLGIGVPIGLVTLLQCCV